MKKKFDREKFAEQWEKDFAEEFVDEEKMKEWERYGLYCSYSQQFALWAEELLAEAAEAGSSEALSKAKLLLQDKYFAWRNSVPVSHQNHTGVRGGHICIYRVWVESYKVLHSLELSLTHPLIVESRQEDSPQIHGLYIGEEGN